MKLTKITLSTLLLSTGLLMSCFEETSPNQPSPAISSSTTNSSSSNSSSSSTMATNCTYDGEVAWVVGSDYNTGALKALNITSQKECDFSLPVWQDASVFTDKNYLYVLESYGSNKWMKIDTKTQKVIWYKAFKAKSNPTDIAFVDSNTAFVNYYGFSTIAKVNLQTGAVTDTISLKMFENGGTTNPSSMLIKDGKLIVAMQRQDANWAPDTAKLAIIDIASLQVVDSIVLKAKNPYQLLAHNGKVLVVNNGTTNWTTYTSDNNGALEEVDLSAHTTSILVTEAELGGKPTHMEFISGDQFYTDIYKSYGDQPMAILNIKTKAITPIAGISNAFGGFTYSPFSQKLVIGERVTTNSGLLLFGSDNKSIGKYFGSDLPPKSTVIIQH